MEGIEKGNKEAIESCYKVLNLISQQNNINNNNNNNNQNNKYKYLAHETDQAVSKFRNVVRNLGSGLGHARARIVKVENRNGNGVKIEQCEASNNKGGFGFVQENGSTSGKSCLSLGTNLSLELCSSSGKTEMKTLTPTPTPTPVHVGHNPNANANAHFQLVQQQELQQKAHLHQQQMKYQAEMMMYRRSNSGINLNFDNYSYTPTMSSNRSFISSLSVDGSVASMNGSGGFSLIGGSRASDPSSSLFKKRCSRGENGSGICGSIGKCHCSKKRKNKVKRSVKVPAISNKLADIPPDDYSWRKYGQKPIKGSPHPRGYYKCSSVRGCPARKHVERCVEEPSMLSVTYEGEHNHPLMPPSSTNA